MRRMSPVTSAARTASKGEETRAAILAAAVEQASASGFESLTIGSLAEKTGMSKSGLFAHFGSKLELQIAALDEASRLFTEGVMMPAMKAPRGLKRVQAIFDGWVNWPQRASLPGGCPIDAATREYHHQPGPMRDAIVERQRILGREISKAVHMAVDAGELRADTDTGQFTFDMFGIILACYRTELMLGIDDANRRARVAFDRLVANHRT